jgi:hypothetical protein
MSKKELIILKLDFEKAFDKVEREVILQVLKHKGFSQNGFHGLKISLNLAPHQFS